MSAPVFWYALLGALAVGLVYYRLVVQPSLREAGLEDAVRAFGTAIELRFPNHAGLTEEVSTLSMAVAKRLGFGPQRQRRLQFAARLRDIGLCAIPFRLVNRRNWPDWTLSETATYDCHSEIGSAILETVPALSPYAEAVRNHHTPFRAEGETPSLDARVLKACAEYVWYRRHFGDEKAASHLAEGSGSQYDPDVAHTLLQIVKPSATSTGMAAVRVSVAGRS